MSKAFSLILSVSVFWAQATVAQQIMPGDDDVHSPVESEIDSLRELLNTTHTNRKAEIYGQLCFTYASTLGDIVLAHGCADSIKSLADRFRDKGVIAASHYWYAVVFRYEGKYSEALDHLQQSTEYYSIAGDSSQLAHSLFQIAIVKDAMGSYDESLELSYKVLAMYRSLKSRYDVAVNFIHIGNLFIRLKNQEKANDMYRQALSIFDSLTPDLKSKMGRLRVLMNLGNSYTELKKYEKAMEYYKESLVMSRSLGSKRTIATTLNNIGEVLSAQKQYDSALIYHLRALAIRKRTSQRDKMLISLIRVGEIYLSLGKYPLATNYLLESLALSKESGSRPVLRDTYLYLSILYSNQNKFKKAYEYHLSYEALKDSILNEETTRKIRQLQMKYETDEKDKTISLLAKEKEIQMKESQRQATLNKAFAVGIFLISLTAILSFYTYRQRSLLTSKIHEAKEADFKRHVSELELKALRAQINPHFLFNCMNAINVMIGNGHSDHASIYLSKFSKLVRLILENAEAKVVTLESEIELLESYIQLEELRSPGKITHSILVDNSIDTQCTYLASMILQPFIENAIWHGIMHRNGEGKGIISIEIKLQGDALLCTIQDNGIGREQAQQLRDASVLQYKSMGLKITEQRLQLMDKQPNHRYQYINIVDLKDENNRSIGTCVTVTIPITHD